MKKEGLPVLVIDLDGVIADYNGWKGVDHFGTVNLEMKMMLKDLDSRCWIIVHTCRINENLNPGYLLPVLVEKVGSWLTKNSIPFDEVWSLPGKPVGSVYLDDKAVPYQQGWNINDTQIRVEKGLGLRNSQGETA